MIECNRTTLCLSSTSPLVSPQFKVVTEEGRVMVIKEYMLLTLIPIPPLVLGFYIEIVSVVLASSSRLPCPWHAPVPHTSLSLMVYRLRMQVI
jgi:hypothetical protein